jgi:hypothetical protein
VGLPKVETAHDRVCRRDTRDPAPIYMNKVLDDFIASNSNVWLVAMLAVKDGEIFDNHSASYFDVGKTNAPTQSNLPRYQSSCRIAMIVS